VGAADNDDEDDEPIADKIERLTGELYAHFNESIKLEKAIRRRLEQLDV
jgi:type I restriction enzyme M protein